MWAIKFLGSQIILCLLFDIEKERQFKVLSLLKNLGFDIFLNVVFLFYNVETKK